MKATIISAIIGIAVIMGAVLLAKSNGPGPVPENVNNVSEVDGKQIIDINVKGGYSPRVSSAKAGVPTVIRMTTQGTFDCSIAVSIPSLKYRKNLPSTGVTDIEIPVQSAGTKLQGLCAMGMYSFVVNFE